MRNLETILNNSVLAFLLLQTQKKKLLKNETFLDRGNSGSIEHFGRAGRFRSAHEQARSQVGRDRRENQRMDDDELVQRRRKMSPGRRQASWKLGTEN